MNELIKMSRADCVIDWKYDLSKRYRWDDLLRYSIAIEPITAAPLLLIIVTRVTPTFCNFVISNTSSV